LLGIVREAGRGPHPGGAILSKTYERNFFTAILHNSENNIRLKRPFCQPIFCHSSVVKYTLTLLQSKPVMRFDCQILLKSSPLPKFTGWIRPWAGAHYYRYFFDFSRFVRLHTLGTIVRQFA